MWKDFQHTEAVAGSRVWMLPGTKLLLSQTLPRTESPECYFIKWNIKRVQVLAGGVKWNIDPCLIVKYDPDDVAAGEKALRAHNPQREGSQLPVQGLEGWGKDQPKVGDVVLMYLGAARYDVVKVTAIMPPAHIKGTLMNGRSSGKDYRYKMDYYVGKLDV